MKARFLALAALLFGMAACQTEPAFDVNMGDGTTTISVVLPEDAITRAGDTDSAWGGLQNEQGEELTVTLYIFDENGNPSVEPHTTTLAEDTTVANFQVRLVPDRHYTFVAWAGQKSADNLFTLGTPAQEDWTITLSDWTAMNEQRDAFTGIYSTAEKGEKFTSASNINLTLTRPFAKVRVVTTDMEWLKNINVTPAYAEVSYEVELPKTFNAYTQAIGTEVFTQKEHQAFEIKDYTKDATGSMTLFTDYILVPESGNVKFTLTVYEAKADGTVGKEIESTSFVTDIFVKRNHLTTIVGDILTDGNNIKVTVEEDFANAQNPNDKPYYIEYKEAGSAQALVDIINEINNSTTNEQTHISLTGDIDIDELLNAGTLSTRASDSKNIKIASGKVIELDLKGFTISGTDKNTAGNFYLINNCGTLTISDSSEAKTGAIKLSATTERNWNASSVVVANNPGGLLVVDGGLIEHLGGTSMAYGVDNLTNGKGTYAETVINGGTIKSTYRAVRQFLNGVEAQNILTVNGGVIEGANKSIWMQDPSKNANTGKLTVKGGELRGNVYLTVTEGSTTWPVEVSIAASTLANGSEVLSNNVPAGYDVVEKNGNWVVEYGVEENGNEVTILNAGGLKWLAAQVNGGNYFAGKTVKLGADIDLNNQEWTPIGSAYADHGFMGNFDGNGFAVKNLKMTELAVDADGYVYAGLFGVTEGTNKDNQNYIKNLVIENVNINTTGSIAAAAIAYPYYTKLENIKVQGNVTIKGGDYTAGVLAYTRRCVDANNISIEATDGSIEGNKTVGGVISDIQMNGGLTANYSNFAASGLTIKAVMSVGGISGIICNQTLNGATVKNVTIVCDDVRKGIVAGSNGGDHSKINNASYENVTGATRIIGATFDNGNYVGQIIEAAGQKAVIYSIANGVKAVSVEEITLNGKTWQYAMDWAANLGEGWALASMEELNAIYDLRCELNVALKADNAENALFWEGDELYIKDGSVYYANYMSSTEVPYGESDANGNAYFANRVFFKQFNDIGYSDVLYSAFDCINKYAPLKDNYFARAVYTF